MGQMPDHRREVVIAGDPRRRGIRDSPAVLRIGQHHGVPVEGSLAVVDAVDAQCLKAVRHGMDLAQEVLRGEAALAQGVRGRVRGGGQPGAGRDQLTEQPCHHHRVARVVEFELVDTEQIRSAQQIDGVLVPESPHQRGVLDERAEVLPTGGKGVIDGCQQVGLPHAESTVEVHPGLQRRLLRRAPEQAPALGRLALSGEALQCLLRVLLRGIRRVGTVAIERGLVELRRRDETRQHLRAGDRGRTVGQVHDAGAGRLCHPYPVSKSYVPDARHRKAIYGRRDGSRLRRHPSHPAPLHLKEPP